MGSRNFIYKFIGVDSFTGPGGAVERQALKVAASAEKMAVAAVKAGEKWERQGQKMRSAGANLSVFSAGVAAFGLSALKQSSSMEQLGVAFDVLIGDTDKAEKAFSDLTEFATKTPFKLEEVAQAGKTLLAFQIDSEVLGDKLRMLGDLAAASGKPLTEFANIFGKIKAKGKVTMEEVNSLAEKGVSILSELAKSPEAVAKGFTTADIAEMVEKGMISFADIDELMTRMTTGSGQFAGLAAEQAKTLGGLWSTLAGNVDLALAVVGDVLVETLNLKGAISGVSDWVGEAALSFKEFATAHPFVIKLMLAVIGLLAVLGPILLIAGQIAISVAALMPLFTALAAGVAAVGLAIAGASLAVLLIPLAIAAVVAALVALYVYWDEVVAFFVDTWSVIKNVFSMIGEALLVAFSFTPLGLFIAGVEKLIGHLGGMANIASKVSGFFGFGGEDEAGGLAVAGGGITDSTLSVTTHAQSDVNVNLRDPGGLVESMSSTTTGSSGARLGTNLVRPL